MNLRDLLNQITSVNNRIGQGVTGGASAFANQVIAPSVQPLTTLAARISSDITGNPRFLQQQQAQNAAVNARANPYVQDAVGLPFNYAAGTLTGAYNTFQGVGQTAQALRQGQFSRAPGLAFQTGLQGLGTSFSVTNPFTSSGLNIAAGALSSGLKRQNPVLGGLRSIGTPGSPSGEIAQATGLSKIPVVGGLLPMVGDIALTHGVGLRPTSLSRLSRPVADYVPPENPGALGFVAKPGRSGTEGLPAYSRLADRKPRVEISDAGMSIKDKGAGTLGTMIDHPKLFATYPELANVKVTRKPGFPFMKEGSYDPLQNTITVNSNLTGNQLKQTLAHEYQHVIQKVDRFAAGTNLTRGGDAYRKSAGEIEARAVESRMNLPQEQLTGTDPYKAQGIPTNQQNVTFDTTGRFLRTGKGLRGLAKQSLQAHPSKPLDPNINVDRLNIPDTAKQAVKGDIETIKDSIAAKTGGRLSNQQAINLANQTSQTFTKAVGADQTLAWQAQLLKTRQSLAEMAQSGKTTPEELDALRVVKTLGTDAARKLQSFSIGADPKTTSAKQQMLAALMDLGHKSDDLLTAAQGVDFNDAKQATDFYRHFVEPTLGEYVDAIRYNSMLSSPNTHINNATGNVLGTALVAPVEKTLTGTLDFLGSAITGKPRQALASEGATYATGYWKSLGEAGHAFADTLRGKSAMTNLDLNRIPLGDRSLRSKIVGSTEYVGRLLEASDQFFTKLAEGGATSALQARQQSGIKLKGNITELAAQDAKYRLFRQDLNDPKQGPLLNAVDFLTAKIQEARGHDNPVVSTIAKYTLPFVKTPMNILKQGIEYSPIGFATLPGAANKTEQLSKAILGSSAAAATAMLVTSGRTTWAAPTDPKKKSAFYASGMQPYSVKIGDRWVAYTKLPPSLSFPIALVSAVHDAQDNKHLTDNQATSILSGVAQWGNFFADQSYLKNIGDLVASVKGDPAALSQLVGNYPQQLIPYRAFLSWVERLTDPNQHQIDPKSDFFTKQLQGILQGIPGLANFVPVRQDPLGQPVSAQNRVLNAVSPFKVTTENPGQKDLYNQLQAQTQQKRFLNDVKKNPDTITALDTHASGAPAPPATPTPATLLSPQQSEQLKQQRSLLTAQAKTAALAGKNDQYRQLQEKVSVIDNQLSQARLQERVQQVAGMRGTDTVSRGLAMSKKRTLALDIARQQMTGQLTQDQVEPLLNQLGTNTQSATIAVAKSLPVSVRAPYVWQQLSSTDPETLIKEKLLTSDVVDALYNQGTITGHEVNILKQGIKQFANPAANVKKPKSAKARKISLKITTPKSRKIAFRSVKITGPQQPRTVSPYKLPKIDTRVAR